MHMAESRHHFNNTAKATGVPCLILTRQHVQLKSAVGYINGADRDIVLHLQ